MSHLPLVIVNPTSAGGATGRDWPSMASELRTHFVPFNCAFTEKRGDARALALNGAKEGRRLIIACGGDGTISDVANGILESGAGAELGILPSGTGGDFRRTLSISNRPAEAARALREGSARLIDVGRVIFSGRDGEERQRYFIGVASFGMSGEVIKRAKQKERGRLSPASAILFGSRLSYAEAMLRTTLSHPGTEVFIKLDDGAAHRLTVANFCIANARYFGGGMKIAPDAKLDDGLFDIISIGDMGALQIILNSPRLYAGWHLNMGDVRHTRTRTLTAQPAKATHKIALEIDGELPGYLPATFEIIPRALKVRSWREEGKW